MEKRYYTYTEALELYDKYRKALQSAKESLNAASRTVRDTINSATYRDERVLALCAIETERKRTVEDYETVIKLIQHMLKTELYQAVPDAWQKVTMQFAGKKMGPKTEAKFLEALAAELRDYGVTRVYYGSFHYSIEMDIKGGQRVYFYFNGNYKPLHNDNTLNVDEVAFEPAERTKYPVKLLAFTRELRELEARHKKEAEEFAKRIAEENNEFCYGDVRPIDTRGLF